MQDGAGGPGTGEGGRNFLSDMKRLADAGDEDFAARLEGGLQEVDCLVKGTIEAPARALQRGDLDVKYRLSFD